LTDFCNIIMEFMMEPNLKFLDVFVCDKIIKCLRDAEA
jgi:hypothetical protein